MHVNGHAFVCHVVRGLFACGWVRYRVEGGLLGLAASLRGSATTRWLGWRDFCGDQKIARQARSYSLIGASGGGGWAQNKAFRTTLRFPSGETSEKIPFACACSVRGIVSAHRCLSAVGFSSPTYYSAHGATSARRFFSACVLWWPCVGRPRGAPGSECTGLLTCVRLPPFV